jgi:hypothetical protein
MVIICCEYVIRTYSNILNNKKKVGIRKNISHKVWSYFLDRQLMERAVYELGDHFSLGFLIDRIVIDSFLRGLKANFFYWQEIVWQNVKREKKSFFSLLAKREKFSEWSFFKCFRKVAPSVFWRQVVRRILTFCIARRNNSLCKCGTQSKRLLTAPPPFCLFPQIRFVINIYLHHYTAPPVHI